MAPGLRRDTSFVEGRRGGGKQLVTLDPQSGSREGAGLMGSRLPPFAAFAQSGILTLGMVPPTLKVGLSFSVKTLWQYPTGVSPMCF